MAPHFSETPVFAGCGVRAVGTNECVSTNGTGKRGFSECESILTTTTDNPKTPHKWYNMQYINMSGNLPMRRRAGNAKVRYSAAYPTGRERI